MIQPVNVDDYERLAQKKLEKSIFDYIAGGSCDEITLARNRAAFNRYLLMPRVLNDVSQINTSITLLGQTQPLPLMVAPTAFHRLVHPDGELSTIKAVNTKKVGMIVSTLSSTPMEEISHLKQSPLWFQLYVYKDRSVTESLIKRAEKSGYDAIVITLDAPFMGKREADIRNQFVLPKHCYAANFNNTPFAQVTPKENHSAIKHYTDQYFDTSLTWKDIAWLRSQTSLPIILKGIMHPEDARLAREHAIDAIIVSNHGGRQLDSMLSTIEALQDIVMVIEKKMPVMMDGGFRRGTDIFKALALGADMVLLGRPILWALAVNGEQGVIDLFDLLAQELIETMAFCGCASLADIREKGGDLVRRV